jgi:hypothetical protein
MRSADSDGDSLLQFAILGEIVPDFAGTASRLARNAVAQRPRHHFLTMTVCMGTSFELMGSAQQ